MKEVSNRRIANAALARLHETCSFAAASYLAMSIMVSQNGGLSKMVSNYYPKVVWPTILEALKALGASTMPYKDGGVIFNLDHDSLVSDEVKENIDYLLLF